MKNLFVITEEEKNRILGLHESATKNQYLINEQYSETVIDKIKNPTLWNTFFGENWKSYDSTDKTFGVKINVSEPVDIIVNITLSDDGNSGTFSFTYPNVSFADETSDIKSRTGGTWSFSNGNFTGSIDGQSISKKSLQEVIYHLLKFFYPMSMQYYSRKSDLSTTQQVVTKPEDVQAGVLKNAQDCGWGNDVEGYKNSGWACPKPGSSVDNSKDLGTGNQQIQQKPKYYQEVVNLQSKVGVENTGSLDQTTLKAIMDKLSQKV